jgi:hypothetical protein
MPANVTTSPAPPVTVHPGPFSGQSTFLCTFTVMADMPTSLAQADMEGLVAQALAVYFANLGMPANVSAQLVATAGNVTVANPTPPVAVVPVTPQGPPV